MRSKNSLAPHLIAAGIFCALLPGNSAKSIGGEPVSRADTNRGLFGVWLWGDTVAGDWGGARTALEGQGVTFTLEYTHEYLANVSGGIRRGGQYNGLALAGIELDMEKLAEQQGRPDRIFMKTQNGRLTLGAVHPKAL
jgi:porin